MSIGCSTAVDHSGRYSPKWERALAGGIGLVLVEWAGMTMATRVVRENVDDAPAPG
jgi:hypothetical protein